MKIGMVSEFYYPQPGGISEHIRALSRELRLLGHEVAVVTSHISGEVPERDPRVLRLGRSLPLRYNGSLSRVTVGWRLGRRLDEVLERERFDLLHIHNPLMPTLPLMVTRRARCPVVATFHSYYERDLLTLLFHGHLERRLGRLAARVPVSPAARRAVEPHFPGAYRIIPNGVDYEFFAEAARREDDCLAGLAPGSLRLLFVGATVRRKGLPQLLDAFAVLRRRRRDVELIVVGDGPDRSRLQRRLPGPVREAVHFVGFVPRQKLAEYYASADVFCAPSLGRESFGMVLLEAMAAALPVVAFDIEGYRDVVRQGVEGLLVAPRDTAALARAVGWFLDRPEERAAYGSRGQARAHDLSWHAIARRLEDVYHEACGLPLPEREEAPRAAAAAP
ncbi:MAG: glycosyltransferase family 4 protein [Candidatus Krumholzibacteriota bacterium]|nr:glycosyltransferase family 4 protein [Candidatus Krumholzibacteriota bacterium]